jgi:hypothetical protein
MQFLACAACGLDPSTGSFFVQVAQAAVIVVPFVLRGQILGAVRTWRARLRGPDPGEACLIENGAADAAHPAGGAAPRREADL